MPGHAQHERRNEQCLIEHPSGPAMPGGSTTWHTAAKKGKASNEQGLCFVSVDRMLLAKQDMKECVRGVHDLPTAIDSQIADWHTRRKPVRFPTPCSLALSKRSVQHVVFKWMQIYSV